MKLNAYLISTSGTLLDEAVSPVITISLGDLVLVDRQFDEVGEALAPAVAEELERALSLSNDYNSFDDQILEGIVYATTELPSVTLSVVTNNALEDFEVHSSLVDISVLKSAQRLDLMRDYLEWGLFMDQPGVDVRYMNLKLEGER